MVSYKILYLNLLKEKNMTNETGYKCPICSCRLIQCSNGELICVNEDCKFDKTPMDLVKEYADKHHLEDY
jgi:hypothetical protein